MFSDIENTFQKPRLNGMFGTSLGEKLLKFLLCVYRDIFAMQSYSDVASDTDNTDLEEPPTFYSPRLRRRRRRRRRRNQPHYFGYIGNEEVDYINTLPEEGRLVQITSNIWGTKFKIHGLDRSLPPLLGQVGIAI